MPAPQASHSSSNTFLKSGKANMRALVSLSLISAKASLADSIQRKEPFFFKQSVIGVTKLLKFQMKRQ